MFLVPVLFLNKYQSRIQKQVSFNSFKPLTISARSYFLEAWQVSEYQSEYYYMNRFDVFYFLFFC